MSEVRVQSGRSLDWASMGPDRSGMRVNVAGVRGIRSRRVLIGGRSRKWS
jgi:hypothetical protein